MDTRTDTTSVTCCYLAMYSASSTESTRVVVRAAATQSQGARIRWVPSTDRR